ncbi:DNA-binding protein [Candidatus Kuenenbacteria bacterium CG22_combo_CG10-13_8_21_14_all_39_9]|uniref:Viral histone-like protein n=1 Tax=Candidatus Kuenenbacteria bacterium CG22_combo_CG10-13_8_21_14_all_39_9 TaxID=1974621 RepID=A0A2H0D230_9BACT|nr:MAG: DNA-binding protein [Candidatus Kuenenbacteria bacterium CG22_combo_CG10-13_8_21_14_all_39_9]
MAKMTKTQIMQALADKSGMAKKDVVSFMDKLTELAYSEVKSNGEFVLPGFGKLVKVNRKAREGRNPATGATIHIPAKIVVKFRVAKAVKDALL